jgi:preprotein translocase subunit SecG
MPLVKLKGVLKTVETILNISLIIISVALIVSVVLQSKGAGLGGLSGQDSGGFFSARRGIEKSLFYATIAFSVLFFLLSIVAVFVFG